MVNTKYQGEGVYTLRATYIDKQGELHVPTSFPTVCKTEEAFIKFKQNFLGNYANCNITHVICDPILFEDHDQDYFYGD